MDYDLQDFDPRDAEPDVKVLREGVRTARTRKVCEACEGPIAPGERHRHAALLIDGAFVTQNRHVCPAMCSAAWPIVQAAQERAAAEYDRWLAEVWGQECAEMEAERAARSTKCDWCGRELGAAKTPGPLDCVCPSCAADGFACTAVQPLVPLCTACAGHGVVYPEGPAGVEVAACPSCRGGGRQPLPEEITA